MKTVIVGAVGEPCPVPVVKATKALRELGEPGTLEVRVDNEIAVQNLTRMAAGNHLPVQAEKKGEHLFVVTMEVAEPVGDAPAEEPALTCVPDARGDLVVAVDSETMGRGSDELGKLLMKSFLFAVSQLPRLPRTVLFYNGGAKLTVEGSESLEDLRNMEAQGVEILTCGTCLNFYGLARSWLCREGHQAMIYLDNAATTRPKPPSVAEAVAAAMNDYGNSGRGTHPEALEAARSIYGVRQALAALFGCSRADRVAFTPNSTMALNIAISGLLGAGDHVISTDLEHNSVLRPLYRLRAQGGAVDFVPADRQGRIDYEDFERLLRPNTKAVVCTHGSNLTGDLMDIQRVGNFCQKHRLLFILDASQTAGVFPIDMERQHISVVCFTGHKSLMGPQGTGGLCVGAGVEIRPFAVGGTGVQSYSETQPEAYPTRLEAGTLNSHGIAGLGASLAFLKRTGWDAVRMHESVLARRFYETVRTIPGVKVYGNFAVQLRAPIVSLNIADLDSSEVADELAERFEIATRPGAHCAPRLHRALGTEDQGAVRFSWSYFNTEAETDAAAEAVRILAAEAV